MAAAVIEPVRRSFAVLEALSRRRTSTLSVLTVVTVLPRPTVARLLHTLAAVGYALRVARHSGYRVTHPVLGDAAHPPRRLGLNGDAAVDANPWDGRADPQWQAHDGQPVDALSTFGDVRGPGGCALRPAADPAGPLHHQRCDGAPRFLMSRSS